MEIYACVRFGMIIRRGGEKAARNGSTVAYFRLGHRCRDDERERERERETLSLWDSADYAYRFRDS